ncbi:unnamed protein product, partial [Heterotrigona itama]
NFWLDILHFNVTNVFFLQLHNTIKAEQHETRHEKLIFIYRRLIEITQTSIKELCGRDSGRLVYRDQKLKSQVIHEQPSQSGESGAQLDTSIPFMNHSARLRFHEEEHRTNNSFFISVVLLCKILTCKESSWLES